MRGWNGFLFVAMLGLFAVGCGSTGAAGDPGAPGADGKPCTVADNGDSTYTITCDDGTTVTIKDGTQGTAGAKGDKGDAGDAGAKGDQGDKGDKGDMGDMGASCSIVDNGDATKTITCGETTVQVLDGVKGDDGASCTVVDDGAGVKTITCGDTSVTVSDGAKGDAGTSCAVVDNDDGTKTITCGEASVTVMDGAKGDKGDQGDKGDTGTSCLAVDNNDGTKTITCGDTTVVVTDGQDGTDVDPAALAQLQALAAVGSESCAVCHSETGMEHQDVYDAYKDATKLGLVIGSVVTVANADDATKFDTTVTFTITKNGQPFVDADGLPSLQQKRWMGIQFTGGQYVLPLTFSNPKGTGTDGEYKVTAIKQNYAVDAVDGALYFYIAQGVLGTEGMTLYDDVASASKTFNGFDAATAATAVGTVSGCEKCHGTPYMKHGYRAAAVDGLADFAACKFCHYDTRNGGHQDWQVLVDDPLRYTQIATTPLTTEEKAKYAYVANVMNDTHMSHAMEFPYPQSMANCATCHEGKLDMVLTDANFVASTCKSCHAVNGSEQYGTAAKALYTIMPANHNLDTMAQCNLCHKAAGIAPEFKTIHTGYDSKIYAADAVKYADWFKSSVDSATFADNKLTFTFKVVEDAASTVTLNAADVVPTVLIGLYGWDTKDYLVGPHNRDTNNVRLLEWAVSATTTHPRLTLDAAADGVWTVTADLTMWADLLANGSVKRAEIGFMPKLVIGGVTVALDAPSRTFDLTTNAFDDAFFGDIVDVTNGCNNCHDALATTFHSGDRGGNIKVCRLCHTTASGGSHLEMQSRSIDSYVHAIHSFQAFDSGDVDMTDPVEAMRYHHHVEHGYPNFTIKNCQSCHTAGAFDIPDQSKSLPGVQSAADAWDTDRAIGAVPSYITGPGSRACGGCHRAVLINEDDAGTLAAFNQHTKSNGYLVTAVTGLYDLIVANVMSLF